MELVAISDVIKKEELFLLNFIKVIAEELESL